MLGFLCSCAEFNMADDNHLSLLVVIFDANPVWWGKITAQSTGEQITLSSCIDSLMVMCNAHLMMNHSNSLAFIASHTNQSKFLFPRDSKTNNEEEQTAFPSDSKCEKFAEMNDIIVAEMKELVANTEIPANASSQDVPATILPSALCMALCCPICCGQYVQGFRRKKRVGGEHFEMSTEWKKNALIVKACPDAASQYLTIMNCIFAAQKNNVIIDACVLHENSGFLQQAADITGGIYLKIDETLSILEHLLWLYLPGHDTRDMLVLPSSQHIDYRAACFCHRKLVDVGFVCSVCLSIYCQLFPRCLTCQTLFKMPSLPLSRSKKKKK